MVEAVIFVLWCFVGAIVAFMVLAISGLAIRALVVAPSFGTLMAFLAMIVLWCLLGIWGLKVLSTSGLRVPPNLSGWTVGASLFT